MGPAGPRAGWPTPCSRAGVETRTQVNLGTFPPTSVPWGKARHLPEPLGITIAALIKGMWQFPVLVSSLPWSLVQCCDDDGGDSKEPVRKGPAKGHFPRLKFGISAQSLPRHPGGITAVHL